MWAVCNLEERSRMCSTKGQDCNAGWFWMVETNSCKNRTCRPSKVLLHRARGQYQSRQWRQPGQRFPGDVPATPGWPRLSRQHPTYPPYLGGPRGPTTQTGWWLRCWITDNSVPADNYQQLCPVGWLWAPTLKMSDEQTPNRLSD